MADRYCILPEGGTGVWTDTAIWSTAENGTGGASSPVGADNAIFPRSANITEVPAIGMPSVTIFNNASVSLTAGDTASRWFAAGSSVDGTLILNFHEVVFRGIRATGRSVIKAPTESARIAIFLQADWPMESQGTTRFEATTLRVISYEGGRTVPPGTYKGAAYIGCDPRQTAEHDGTLYFTDADYDFDDLRLGNTNPANAMYNCPRTTWHLGRANLTVRRLVFDIRNTEAVLEISRDDALITVTGDILDWTARADALDVGPGLEIVLTGTQDQAVALPPETDGLVTLALDKPAGLVTLQKGDVDLKIQQYGASLTTLPGTKVRT